MSEGMYLNSLSFRYFHPGLIVESIKELGGASSMKMMKHPTKRTCWSSMTIRQNQHEKNSRKGKKKATNQTYNEGSS
jgi:hypothetical protein